AACAAAKAEGKLVFIDFYTTWCEPCKRLDQLTWTDAGVGQLVGDQAVPLKLDAEKERDLSARYKINLYPTLLVVRPDGKEVARTYAPAKDALLARRDDARSRAVANKGGTTVVQDLIALNRELKADEDTVAVYDLMPAGDRRRTTISIYLFDYFVDKKRYADA